MKTFVQITIGELEFSKNKLLYKDFAEAFRQTGSAVSAFRSVEGIGEHNEIRSLVLESVPFNNLPIIIETMQNERQSNTFWNDLIGKMPRGNIVKTTVYRHVEDESIMEEHPYLMLKIYLYDQWHLFKPSLHREILEILRQHELLWSTVQQGIYGFGNHGAILKKTAFPQRAPLLIETVGPSASIRRLLPLLQSKLKNGLMITIPVEVVLPLNRNK